VLHVSYGIKHSKSRSPHTQLTHSYDDMFAQRLTLVAAALGLASALPKSDSSRCTAAQRLHYSEQIPYAYAQPGVVATFNAFHAIPFGVPDLNGACITEM